jgi:DNA-directed RNA polymerase specialized sigma24 family protein
LICKSNSSSACATHRTTIELLPEEVEPGPLYQGDDEDFWQSHELEYPKNAEVFSGTIDRSREDAASNDELAGRVAPSEREVLLMHEVHGVAPQEVAVALRISRTQAERLLESGRRRLRAAGKIAPRRR